MTSFQYNVVEDGTTVEKLLREEWQAGKKTVHFMRMEKSVTGSNGEPIEWKSPLKAGTELIFTVPGARSTYTPSSQEELEILFEDAHILAVVKPAGIATHPDGPDQSGTLMNNVMAYIEKNGGDYAEHIHRLDKGTAGVLIVAKHPIAKALFDRMIEHNEIIRKYHAEVDGSFKRPKGTIRLPIGRDRHHPQRRRVSPTGQAAVTHFRILERKSNTTIIEAELETGRTHQIRVHLAHLGYPVTGDTLYEGSETADGEFRLTAIAVSFTHPFTKEKITIEI